MKKIISAALLIAGLVLSSAAISSTALAQCGPVTVFNNTGCKISLCLYDNAVVNPICFPVGPGASVIAVPAGFTPAGVVSAAKNRYAFVAAPPVVPGCTPCITLPGGAVIPGCCGVVCYDNVACTITINPCGPTCLP